jgi:hypothetical protein
MSPDHGWIRLHRRLQANPLWRQKRQFSMAEAWIDLLLEARHSPEPEKIIIGLHIIECGRGQCIKSLDTWAKRWNWSKSRVRRVLNLFQNMNMICLESVTKSTRITICNYDLYNPFRNTNETQTKRMRNANETHSAPNNNDNNVNNENNENNNITIIQLPDSLNVPFDDFWNAYDKKVGNKEKLRRRWASLSDAQRQAAMDYIPLYLQSQPDKKFRKNPETFLNNKSWTDELIFSSHEPKQKSGTSRISRQLVEEVYSALPPGLRPG